MFITCHQTVLKMLFWTAVCKRDCHGLVVPFKLVFVCTCVYVCVFSFMCILYCYHLLVNKVSYNITWKNALFTFILHPWVSIEEEICVYSGGHVTRFQPTRLQHFWWWDNNFIYLNFEQLFVVVNCYSKILQKTTVFCAPWTLKLCVQKLQIRPKLLRLSSLSTSTFARHLKAHLFRSTEVWMTYACSASEFF